MTITKHKNKSIGISFALFAMILTSITLIMACSGLQNQDTSGRALVGQKFTINSPIVTINGHTYPHTPDSVMTSYPNQVYFPALGIMYIKTGNYGAFLISGQSFSGAKPIGTISGDHIRFTINNRNVDIACKSSILPLKSATVWVDNIALPNLTTKMKKSNWIGFAWAQNLDSLKKKISTPYKSQRSAPPAPPVPKYASINGKHERVYVVTTKMPMLIGGLASIQSRLQYPELARKAGIEGHVYVEFVVDRQGNVVDPKVVRGIGGGCDKEALKLVKQAHFIPGMQNGKKVNVRYSLPIVFKLFRSHSVIQNIN